MDYDSDERIKALGEKFEICSFNGGCSIQKRLYNSTSTNSIHLKKKILNKVT